MSSNVNKMHIFFTHRVLVPVGLADESGLVPSFDRRPRELVAGLLEPDPVPRALHLVGVDPLAQFEPRRVHGVDVLQRVAELVHLGPVPDAPAEPVPVPVGAKAVVLRPHERILGRAGPGPERVLGGPERVVGLVEVPKGGDPGRGLGPPRGGGLGDGPPYEGVLGGGRVTGEAWLSEGVIVPALVVAREPEVVLRPLSAPIPAGARP